jgi:outer membrane protein OmpA-like peptidoglycan-associated protein
MAATGCGRDRAESQRILDQVTESYQHLGPSLGELQGKLAPLHGDVELLAAALPAGGELRARYFTTQEILGVIDGKMKWLSGEIEDAKRAPRIERTLAIRDTLARTRGELAEVSKAVVEIVHESSRLQRVLALVKTPERFGAFHAVLATGVEIKGADDGAEAGLMNRIESLGRKTGWVDFDRVFFVGQSEELDVPASRAQLDNVAQILKTNPSVKLEIGGYRGQAPVNGSPPQERARAVMQALVQMGVAPARLRAIATPAPALTAGGGVGLRVWAK